MILCVDSSGLAVQFSLADSGGLELASVRAELRSEISRDMSQLYASLLERAGLEELPQIARILAGQGPGAFIGTRVALSFANGMAAAGGIPMQGFDSLAAMRLAVVDANAVAVRDARRGQFYVNDAAGSRLLDEAGLRELVESTEHIISDAVPAGLGQDRSLARLQDILAFCPGRLSWLEEIPPAAMLAAATFPGLDYVEPIYLRGYL